MKPYQFYLQIAIRKLGPTYIACFAGVFVGRANVFARLRAKLILQKRGGVLSHKIKEGEYSDTNINKQLLPAQNTPTVYMEGGSTLKGLTGDPRVFSAALQRFSFASVNWMTANLLF